MKVSRVRAFGAAALLLAVSPAIFALPDRLQGPTLPTPGPEHQILKMDEGTWDAAIELFMPGAPAMASKGVEVNTIGCGGLCLVVDFKGEMAPGAEFTGRGLGTWDAVKKKYVSSWTDSMSQGLATGESTWDPAKKQLTGWMEGPDMNGKVVKMRTVADYKDAGTRVFTAFAPGPDGKEFQTMRITYSRRKAPAK